MLLISLFFYNQTSNFKSNLRCVLFYFKATRIASDQIGFSTVHLAKYNKWSRNFLSWIQNCNSNTFTTMKYRRKKWIFTRYTLNFRVKERYGSTNYLKILGVYFPLSIWKLKSSFSINTNPLHRTIGEDTLLCSIWVQILHRLVGKDDLLGSVGVVLLDLITENIKG